MPSRKVQTYISKATFSNWKRLDTNGDDRLRSRANKSLSRRKIVAKNYNNSPNAKRLLAIAAENDACVDDIIYTFCIQCLQHFSLIGKPHVAEAMSRFNYSFLKNIVVPPEIWNDKSDLIGFVYQSITTEGERNRSGMYYTSQPVVNDMTGDIVLADNETLLDPCCGSGEFLVNIKTDKPENLFGIDNNPVAVMIATTRILVRHAAKVFRPNICCMDFLGEENATCAGNHFGTLLFSYVVTNPPWGVDRTGSYKSVCSQLKSRERAALFLFKSLSKLQAEGQLRFLLPMSVLRSTIHKDTRKLLLNSTQITSIRKYKGCFDGVFTNCFSIGLTAKATKKQRYLVENGDDCFVVEPSEENVKEGFIPTIHLTDIDKSISRKIEARRNDDLSHSQWALGIVTGDNKNKLKSQPTDDTEQVVMGRNIADFTVTFPTTYIHFNPLSLQQCAKEELYRSEEKLIYRFISRYPVVAYDTSRLLCLNSANVVIPHVESLSVKSVAALLNSLLYRYYYSLRFDDVKVLKSNLIELPFPRLTRSQDEALCKIVDAIISGKSVEENTQRMNKLVFSLFELSVSEQRYVEQRVIALRKNVGSFFVK